MATEIDGTLESARPEGRKTPALVIANRQEIAGAEMEALLQAGGYIVVKRCLHEHDLLRSAEAYRPDIILLAENIVGQEAAETVLRLRALNGSGAVIILPETRGAVAGGDCLESS